MATPSIIPAPEPIENRIATFEARLAEAERQRDAAQTFTDRQIAEMWVASFENDLFKLRSIRDWRAR